MSDATEYDARQVARAAMLAGTAAFRRRDFAEAARQFESAAISAPGEFSPWLSLGRARLCAGSVAGARRACNEAQRRAPQLVRIHLLAARLAVRANDGRSRVKHLETAIALRSDAVALRLQLVAAFQRRIQPAAALAVAEQALLLAPGNVAVRIAAARCRLAAGQLAEAEALLDGMSDDLPLATERAGLREAIDERRKAAGHQIASPGATSGTDAPAAKPRAPAAAVETRGPSPDSGRPVASTGPGSAGAELLLSAASLERIARLRRRPSLIDHLLILRALVLRDIRVHHRDNRLGILVELVRPATIVVVHYWLFVVLKKAMPGQIPISVYVVAGFSTWFAFNASWIGAGQGGKWPGGATSWPGVTDLHMRIARAGWAVLINLIFCLLALVPLRIFGSDLPFPRIPETCAIFAMAGLSGFGLGLTLERLGTRVSLIKTFEKILSWALFVTSGLYFSLASTPQLLADWFWYSPLLHLIEYERQAFVPAYPVALLDLRYPAIVAIVLLVTGLLTYGTFRCQSQD